MTHIGQNTKPFNAPKGASIYYTYSIKAQQQTSELSKPVNHTYTRENQENKTSLRKYQKAAKNNLTVKESK